MAYQSIYGTKSTGSSGGYTSIYAGGLKGEKDYYSAPAPKVNLDQFGDVPSLNKARTAGLITQPQWYQQFAKITGDASKSSPVPTGFGGALKNIKNYAIPAITHPTIFNSKVQNNQSILGRVRNDVVSDWQHLNPFSGVHHANQAISQVQKQYGLSPEFVRILHNAGTSLTNGKLAGGGASGLTWLPNKTPSQVNRSEITTQESKQSGNGNNIADTIIHEGLHQVWAANPKTHSQFARVYNSSVTPELENYLRLSLGVSPKVNLSNFNKLPPALQDEVHSGAVHFFTNTFAQKTSNALTNYYGQFLNVDKAAKSNNATTAPKNAKNLQPYGDAKGNLWLEDAKGKRYPIHGAAISPPQGSALAQVLHGAGGIVSNTVKGAAQIGPNLALEGTNLINKARGAGPVNLNKLKADKHSEVGHLAKITGATGGAKQTLGDILQTASLAAGPEADALGSRVAGKVLSKGAGAVGRTVANTGLGYTYGASGALAQGGNLSQINKAGLENAALGGGLTAGGSALSRALKIARDYKTAGVLVPRSALDLHTAPETVVNPKGEPSTSQLTRTAQEPSKVAEKGKVLKPLNESGSLPVGDVQKLIEKHDKLVSATGNISGDFAKTQGRTSEIKLDVAKVLKQRAKLSNIDKQTIQDYRDAKAAGLKPTPLPEHLQEADANITTLNKAAQAADAEKARLSGQEQQAQKIEARNPETYTHRIAQGKGSSLELTARGDRQSPLSVGSLSKTTAGSKKQVFLNATDEAGNRTTVAVKKGKITAFEQGGKKVTDLGNLNLKTNVARMQSELKPVQNRIDALEKEQKILSSTKSRSAAASQRLDNIKTKLQEAYREHANVTNKYDLNELDNKTFVGKDGKKYTLGQATQSEITKATGQKYYVDPELTSHLNYADSRVALENTRFVEGTKKVLEDKDLAFPEGTTAPRGFKTTTNPYFRGYKMEPKLAEVLNDIGGKSQDGTHILRTVGNVLRQTIVYLPLKHDFNELAGFTIDRGLSKWVNPVAYGRLGKSLVAATKEVAQQGPLYRKMLREGSTLMTADDKQLGKVVAKQVKDLAGNENRVKDFAKAFGMSPVRAYNALQKVTVWDVQDVLNVARVHERMQGTLFSKPMSFEDALKATEHTNFQYKIPSRVALPGVAGRDAAKLLKSDATYFGAYTYDKYRIAKNIVKGTANIKHPAEALRSADQLAATAVIALGLWPAVDKLTQKITGDKNAHITAPGVASIPEAAKQVIQHQKTLTAAAGSQISISGPYSLGAQLYGNTDAFTKKPIWDVNSTESQKSKDISKWVYSQLSPVQKAGSASRNTKGGALAFALSLAGVSTPKNSPAGSRLQSLQYDTLPGVQTKAKSQGKKGDLAGALGTIRTYDAKVLQAAKADLKEQGKPIPDDNTLIKQLKKSGQYYMPKQTTIKGWSQPKKKVPGGFSL